MWIEFPGVVQTKRRPAVILSSAAYHTVRPDIIVGLITSQTSKANASTDHMLTDWRSAGLRVPSAFRSFLVTLPRSSVINTMGSLAQADWDQVVARVRLALELS